MYILNYVPIDVGDDPSNVIIGALVAVLMMLGTGLVYLVKTFKEAQGANSAVNNIGPGEHRLYDKLTHVVESQERIEAKQDAFDVKGWATLPPDISSASGLTEVIRDLQHGHKCQLTQLDRIENALADHVKWEENQKYKES